MGAAATTAKQPLAEVDIKNEIGVLYGEEARQAFAAAKEDDVVAWPQVQAYAEAHGLLDPKACALHGAPAKTLDELYAVAEKALLKYGEVMTAACPDGAVLKLAPLKGRARAAAKARNEYAKNTAPATSWLFDVVRGSVMCATEDEIVRLYAALDKDPRVDVVRTKNRFNPPCFNGYRDILMNVAVRVEGDAGEVSHLCELQIHHAPIKESEPMHKSHVTYEFFREFFLGNADAVEERLNMLCALPVDDAENVDDLVDRVLGSDRASDTKLLLELVKLLESIAEHASSVRVQEKVLEIKEREFGPDHREVAITLRNLGNAYGDLGDYAKQRELLERALAIQEREYGRDHVEVATVLMNLGNAHGSLGDYAKSRELYERALAIEEREYGGDHVQVAKTLHNLGSAHGDLGDYAKQRELLERALAIEEREYGGDHVEVASTLGNLGNAYNSLGDAAKSRELYERALAIEEREYGREHVQVASTLGNLGNAHGDLGDYAKKRELLERALAIFEREYGRDHVQVAKTLHNLGSAHGDLGDYAKQRELLERAFAIDGFLEHALAIFKREFGGDHRHALSCRRKLGV
ncbi:hypothetical protein JL722_7812 [Aureococcus anophagefferens]|nr:hypothetical protein JL722_7812 [Aureococcus anophagefferens]